MAKRKKGFESNYAAWNREISNSRRGTHKPEDFIKMDAIYCAICELAQEIGETIHEAGGKAARVMDGAAMESMEELTIEIDELVDELWNILCSNRLKHRPTAVKWFNNARKAIECFAAANVTKKYVYDALFKSIAMIRKALAMELETAIELKYGYRSTAYDHLFNCSPDYSPPQQPASPAAQEDLPDFLK